MTTSFSMHRYDNTFHKYFTLEQPGVNAPGTAKMITFLPLVNSFKLTLFAGVSSKRSALGMASPSCKNTKS